MAFKFYGIQKKGGQATRIKAYKFKVYPENQLKDFPSEIKKAIFEQSRLMNDLWNRLAEIRRATLAELSVIRREEIERLPPKETVGKQPSSAELKKLSPAYSSRSQKLWQSYEHQIKTLASDEELIRRLAWNLRADVFNRFEIAHHRSLKNGGEIKAISNYIRQFHFPYRFTGGGRAAPLIHTGRSKKLFVEPVPAEFFESESYRNRLRRVVSGRFGVGMNDSSQIPFRLVMHRRVPETAMIKQAIFTGQFKNRAWEYFLVLIVEDAPEPNESKESAVAEKAVAEKAVAGIDLGWRKFEDYIRFGVIADSNGNLFELRLPHRLEKQQSLRRLERLLAKHGADSPKYPQTWQDIEDWQQANDAAANEVKEAIGKMSLPRTETTKGLLDNLNLVRKSGLLRLLRELETDGGAAGVNIDSAESETGDSIKAVRLLSAWRDACFAREKEIDYCRRRLINYRNHHYRLLVRWLRENYAQIVLVKDLPLQMIAVEAAQVSLLDADGPVMRHAAKYRQRVALSELLRQIKRTATAGADNWLLSVKGGNTFTRCLTCGEQSPKTSQLITICGQGHRHDRDAQKAFNLRNEASTVPTVSSESVRIPADLKNIIAMMNNLDVS